MWDPFGSSIAFHINETSDPCNPAASTCNASSFTGCENYNGLGASYLSKLKQADLSNELEQAISYEAASFCEADYSCEIA